MPHYFMQTKKLNLESEDADGNSGKSVVRIYCTSSYRLSYYCILQYYVRY
jgi:hypothetical protein